MHKVDTHHNPNERTILGFWMYLMTDGVLFAVLFAVFAVMRKETFGGATIQEVFTYRRILMETLVLLFSSYAVGPLYLAVEKKRLPASIGWMILTLTLGIWFLVMQITDFELLVQQGMGWQKSGFLSAYFTLLGTHTLHVVFGLIWMVVLAAQLILWDFHPLMLRRFFCLKLFWQFIYFVWIFVFTFVYLMSAV